MSNSLQPLPAFSGHGIFQARILEWVAISFFIIQSISGVYVSNPISQFRPPPPPAKCFVGFKNLEASLGLILEDYIANEPAPGATSQVIPVVAGQVKFGTNRETVLWRIHGDCLFKWI